MADTVSVKDFGAVGDGVADDAAAIQAAVSYVGSVLNGGTVYFPAGNYRITTTINIAANAITLLGAGSGSGATTNDDGTSIIYPTNATCFSFVTDLGGGVCNMVLRPVATATAGAAILFNGTSAAATSLYGFVDTVCIQGAFIGIDAYPRAARCNISNCVILNAVSISVRTGNTLDATIGGTSIAGCFFSTASAPATHIKAETLGGLRIVNCRFVNGAYCINATLNAAVTTSKGLLINACSIDGFSSYGVYVEGTGANDLSDFVISNCVVTSTKNSTASGISVNLGTGIQGRGSISGNVFDYTGSGFGIPIAIEGGEQITVTGNVLRGTGSVATGVKIGTSAKNVTVVGNTFKNWAINSQIDNAATSALIVINANMSDFAPRSANSANPLPVNDEGVLFDVLGTTSFSSISRTNQAGRIIVLRFAGALTVSASATLKMGANYITTANDTMTLICDGTGWNEMARSVNT